jgi:hypothetical protein
MFSWQQIGWIGVDVNQISKSNCDLSRSIEYICVAVITDGI